MADIISFIPFLLKWSAGVNRNRDENEEELFQRAKRSGWSKHPLDRGGATQCDVTLTSYKNYCNQMGLPVPTEDELRDIPFSHWKDILKRMYWNRWQADKIRNQSLAELLVDWVWASGGKSIRCAQRIIGVDDDGEVGNITLSTLNSANTKLLFSRLHVARVNYAKDIVRRNPSQKIWLRGWLNRINDIKYRA